MLLARKTHVYFDHHHHHRRRHGHGHCHRHYWATVRTERDLELCWLIVFISHLQLIFAAIYVGLHCRLLNTCVCVMSVCVCQYHNVISVCSCALPWPLFSEFVRSRCIYGSPSLIRLFGLIRRSNIHIICLACSR